MHDDHFRDACGVFGVFGHPRAAALTCLGLHALQHRGQDSAGIASAEGPRLHLHRAEGRVADVFDEPALARLPGSSAIGHVRYATAGGGGLHNAQPLMARYEAGPIAIAHNGNLTNAPALRERLAADGSVFLATSDTEVIVQLLARARAATPEARLREALAELRGAWSLVVLTPERMLGVRDPHGVRPLVIGRLGAAWLLASETCALQVVGASFVREVAPGEIVTIDARGLHAEPPADPPPRRACVFEHVYFARPDSRVFGASVYGVRRELGRRLAREAPVVGDVVIPVPDSGVPAALGFAQVAGIPYEVGLVYSRSVGRTFIEPTPGDREAGVRLKFSPVDEVVAGRRVVLVDDSLVRGTTARVLVSLLRGAGASEVHLRLSSPPIAHPCFYGIATPDVAELPAAHLDPVGLARALDCDSVAFLSRDGLLEAAGGAAAGFCDACFSGNYDLPRGESPGDPTNSESDARADAPAGISVP